MAEIDARRPSVVLAVATEVSDGHQCQPSLFIACANRVPLLPSGNGGIGGCFGG